MIQIKLIPDGGSEVPVEATDHGVLASYLEAGGPPSDASPLDSWTDIKRIVPGNRRYIRLRMPGELDEYSEETLQDFCDAVCNEIKGLKQHPNGWQEVETEEPEA